MPERSQSRNRIAQSGRIASVAAVIFLLLVTTLYLQSSPLSSHTMPPITHVLLVSFKPTAKPEAILRISKQFVALKETCLHPRTQKPYILASKGGINNSPEGSEKGFTHGFILEFSDAADREYFLDTDPAHKAFVSAIIPENGDFLTLDFTEGIY